MAGPSAMPQVLARGRACASTVYRRTRPDCAYALMTDQSSESMAKSLFTFLYHAIPFSLQLRH
jgi:hypothetical protein